VSEKRYKGQTIQQWAERAEISEKALQEFTDHLAAYCEGAALADNQRGFHTGAEHWLALANVVRNREFFE
jgi:hypothetical protein